MARGDDNFKGKTFLGSFFNEKRNKIIIFLLSAVVIVLALIFVWNYLTEKISDEDAVPTCIDGSFYDTCNLNKPYYCDSQTGKLVEKASLCGCPAEMIKSGEKCISQYQTGGKEITLKYVLRGEEKKINFTVYNGMAEHLSQLSKAINYEAGEKPLRSDFKLRNINNIGQKQLLIPLLMEIYNLAETKEDRVRIAVSVAQHIEFGQSNKTLNLPGKNGISYSRYPYEVLYDQQGVCGEKSELLAFLLKEMGYGVVFFYYPNENHEALGIKCPVKYSVDGTGYCFIETTGPSIITDSGIEYVGGIKLKSKPEVILVSNGDALGEDMYEYKDAKKMMKIRDGKFVLFREKKLNELKKKYGLVEVYDPR